mmetsp:Transcript_22490/g.41398  ORF Transcript_22490/g.41398 Transcript_22490/m.41398 type:complete len:312 (+) Transcript_22490:129-1064(+)
MAAGYGAVPPPQQPPPSVKRTSTSHGWSDFSSDLLKNRDFLIIWLVPTAVQFFTMLMWTYCFFWMSTVCVFLTALGVVVCIFFLVPAVRRACGEILLPLGITCLPALLLGAFVGLYLYDSYAIFPYFYRNSRVYTNVSPTESAAAVGDGGKLVFSAESYVDVDSGVSYNAENGNTYCVAPIHDNAQIDRVQFWAAGINCCKTSASANATFECDAAHDNSAHSGIVVFDNNGYFEEARYKYYQRARDKAEATYSLNSVTRPLYVRWVKESNLDMLVSEYSWRCIGFLFLFLLLDLLVHAVLAYNLFRFRKAV